MSYRIGARSLVGRLNKTLTGSLFPALLLLSPPSLLTGQEGRTSQDSPAPYLTLDGTLHEAEWEGTLRHPMTPQGEVLFLTRGENLSVGVRGPGFGLAHLAIASPDKVWVLHASAALGRIVYARGPEGWDKVEDPVWDVRDSTLTSAAVQARGAYFAAHGWVATTGRMGRENEVEFLVQIDRFGGEAARLAVVFFPVGPPGAIPHWPDTLQDDVVEEKLLTGPMPERLQLEPGDWGRIILP